MRKTGVSKCFCTAIVSGNYNQTTESYAQAAAMSELVVGGCIVVTRRMTAAAERVVRAVNIFVPKFKFKPTQSKFKCT